MTQQDKPNSPKPRHADGSRDRYFSHSIGNALQVLELFQSSPSPLSLAEISRLVQLPKSSAFRILRTLEISSYLQRVDGDRFCLMPGAGFSVNRKVNRVVAASQAGMKNLGREFRETISLACLLDNHIEVAAVIDSPQRVSMGNVNGDIIPPHASSLGKCIAAYQPDGRRERLLRSFSLVRFTPRTIVDETALNKAIELVRKQGYATDIEESVLGGCCLSAPIFERDSQAVAAISISMPKMRFVNQDRLVTAVKNAAKAISKELQNQ